MDDRNAQRGSSIMFEVALQEIRLEQKTLLALVKS